VPSDTWDSRPMASDVWRVVTPSGARKYSRQLASNAARQTGTTYSVVQPNSSKKSLKHLGHIQ
jgi:hypothetical protein